MLALTVFPLMAQTDWYNNAQARIDTLRKGNFTINVKTPEGVSLTDSVRVVMKKHEFSWGYAVDLYGGSGDDWQKSIMLRYCNFGVNGNSFKWSSIQPNAGAPNYSGYDNTIAWFQEIGWGFRAHTLLWGGTSVSDTHAIPQWVMDQRSTPKVMTATCSTRVAREVTHYKGIVKEYDVMNEPTHANYLQSVVGDSINWNCFKWAHAADPSAKLFLNDYNIIEYGNQTDNFVNLAKRILQKGGPIGGLGTQSHIGNTVNLDGFKTNLDKLASVGLPLKVTEFDMNFGDGTVMTVALEKQYADEMGKMLRLCFSYPAIEGFIFWGMTGAWAKGVINPYRDDRTYRMAADTINNLINKQWRTEVKGKLNEEGMYTFNGYYGDYEVQVKMGNEWKKFDVSCVKAKKGDTLNLVSNTVKAVCPTLQEITLVEPNQIHLRFDKNMSNPSAKASYFKVFDSKTNGISSASLKSGDAKTVVLTLNNSIGKRDYIPVAFFGNSYSPYTSFDGGVLKPFGGEIATNLSWELISAATSTNGRQVKLEFFNNLMESSIEAADFSVTINSKLSPISSVTVGSSKNVLLLELTNPITKGTDVVRVTYNGSLRRFDGRYVAALNARSATNSVVAPKLVAAKTMMTGKTIFLSFNVDMSSATGLDSCFTLSSSKGNKYVVTKATTSSKKTEISLTLESPIYQGDVVLLSYKGSALTSFEGVPLANFTYSVSNNSVTDLMTVNDVAVAVTPNPFTDKLLINHNGNYTTLLVTDLEGRVVLQQAITSKVSETLSTSSWEKGVYMIVLSDGKKQTSLKVVKK